MRGALLGVAAAVLLVACGDSTGSGAPAASSSSSAGGGTVTVTLPADPNAPQPFTLYTHCGVIFTDFQRVTWYADPPLTDGNGNPPPGFGNPTDKGTMQRVSAHEADYVSSTGRKVVFRDTLAPGASPPGLCS
jgi:hypothetical protein